MSGRDEHPRARPDDGPVRPPDLDWQALPGTGERYLPFSEFARLGFLQRWNVFLGADGFQTPFVYPSHDFSAEPVGFDIIGHGLSPIAPVVDPMISSGFDHFQEFARPDFSPAERAEIRRRRLLEQRRRERILRGEA